MKLVLSLLIFLAVTPEPLLAQPTYTGFVYGTNVLVAGQSSRNVVVKGLGAGFTTWSLGNPGPVVNLTAANGLYSYRDAVSLSGPNGYGIVLDPLSGQNWITNATYKDVVNFTGVAISGDGSSISASVGDGWSTAAGGGTLYNGSLTSWQSINVPAFTSSATRALLANADVPGSAISTPINLAGSTNLNGSTGIAPLSLSSNQLPNDLWEAVQLANLAANRTNFNRYGTSNTFWALRYGLPLNLLLCGNGWVNAHQAGQFDYIFDGLTNRLGVRGFYSQIFNLSGSARYTPITWTGSATINQKTVTWWAPYFTCTGNGAGYQVKVDPSGSLAGFAANVFEVDYVQNSGGGNFDVATNAGGAWGVVTTLNGFAASPTGATYRWTNTSGPLSGYTIALTNKAAGANNCVAFGFINTNVVGGLTFVMQTQQGTSPQEFETCPASVRAPIYRSWNPTLILDLWSCFNTDIYYPPLHYFYKTNTPLADVVVNTQFQVNYPGAADPMDLHWIVAKTNGFSYFCGIGSVDGQGLALRGGLYGDGGHLSAYGQGVFGKLLWAWLGLNETH